MNRTTAVALANYTSKSKERKLAIFVAAIPCHAGHSLGSSLPKKKSVQTDPGQAAAARRKKTEVFGERKREYHSSNKLKWVMVKV